MEKCAICQKETDKCCSLCRRLFYCSPQHQEVHWHMIHKFNCEGKTHTNDVQQEQFKIYNQSMVKSNYQTGKTNEQEAKAFIQLFEDRLMLRKTVLVKYMSARQANTPPLLNKQLVKECVNLHELSKKITQIYKASISDILQESYGLITNNFIIKMDQILDKVLLARCYQLSYMTKQLKQILMIISSQCQPMPQYVGEQFKQTYRKMLGSIIDVSEQANLDKITQKMLSYFIKLSQRYEGIWQQIYAYYNMGIWYGKKTYYQKAIKCFTYALQLVTSHKTSKEITENTIIFKGQSLYNMAISRHAVGEKDKAIQNMLESYRLRTKGLGKSSLQASDCLFILSKWYLQQHKFENCLQYVMECLRIRKSNSAFAKQLQQVNQLIMQIYQNIHKQREQNEQMQNPKNNRYYDKLLESQENYKESMNEKKQSFTKRLLEQEKQYIQFKLSITPELAATFSSAQWSKVGELIDLIDSQMEKNQAIRIIWQSQFSLSLSQEQRDIFIKLNKIV